MLSGDFYQEILAHPIPNDLEAVKLLGGAPAVLDLYMWLSYRCLKAKSPESIPIFGEVGLANQLGCVEYSRPRRFRAMLEQWLTTIRAIWPDLPGDCFVRRIDGSFCTHRFRESGAAIDCRSRP
jgi:hypothetical protein